MKNYLIRILYCGEDNGLNYFFKSNKKSLKGILKDFYIWKEEDEDVSSDEVYEMMMEDEDIIELLVCLEDRKILIDNGEEE